MRFRAFVISSVLLFVATILAVWVDFDKDWKKYQKEFNNVEYNKTQEELDALKKSMDSDPDFKNLSTQLASAEEKINSPEAKTKQEELERTIKQLKYKKYTTERDAKFTKSRL